MSDLILQLFKDGFLQTGEIDGKQIFHLTTPCRFNISQNAVKVLKDRYLSDEEIGGILWAKPTVIGDEKVYVIDKVKFLRNDIEDSPYYDKDGKLKTKKDTYRPDTKSYHEELKKIFSANHLPIKFHTHPTKEIMFWRISQFNNIKPKLRSKTIRNQQTLTNLVTTVS